MPPSTFSLNFFSNSSLVFRIKVGCLWKSSDAVSFLRRRRCSSSVCFLCCTSSFVKFGPGGCVGEARVADRTRAPRDPLAGTRLSVLKRALVSTWPSLAERRLHVAHGSSICFFWRLLRSLLLLSRLLHSHLFLSRLLHSPLFLSRLLRSPLLCLLRSLLFLSCSLSSLCSKPGGFSLVSPSCSVSCLVSLSFSCSLFFLLSFIVLTVSPSHLLRLSLLSGTDMAWVCEPPAPMLGASMCPASLSGPGG